MGGLLLDPFRLSSIGSMIIIIPPPFFSSSSGNKWRNTNSLLIVSSCTVSERARAARLVVHEKRTGCPANRDFLYYFILRGRSESTFQKYQDTDRYR